MMVLKQQNNPILHFLNLVLIALILSSCGILSVEIEEPSSALDPSQPKATSVANSTYPAPTSTRAPSPTNTTMETHTVEAAKGGSKPTSTPILLATQMPQSDLDAPLTDEGPWFLYCTGSGSGEWYVANADGTGRTMVDDAIDCNFPSIVPSKNSNFIALHFRDEDENINDISIIQLPDMETLRTIDTISYPGLLDTNEYNDPNRGSKYALREDPIWSPDGRYLAFVGATEGPSSDVYMYDTLTDQVRRLTSGPNQAVSLSWSPDSRWIVHREVEEFGAGCYDVATWASAVDGSGNRWLYQPQCDCIMGWMSPSIYMSYDGLTGKARNLRIVDIKNGQVILLFPGEFIPYGFDPNSSIVFFEPISGNSDTPQYPEGVYRISAATPAPEFVYSEHILLEWDESLQRLVSEDLPCEEGYLGTLTSSGDFECVERSLSEADLSWSPDRKWAIDKETGRTLNNAVGEIVREITPYGPYNLIWRTDSKGVFLYSDSVVLYLHIPDGDLILVDDRSPAYVSWVGAE